MSDTSEDLMSAAAERLAERRGFMANVLSVALGGGIDRDRLGRELDCAPADAVRVALMRAPRPDAFRKDVAAIAEAGNVDAVRLLRLIRQAQTVEAFAADAMPESGLLMAAQDRIVPDGER